MSVQYINSYVFDSPCIIAVSGSTKTGKSTLIKKIIENRSVMFKQRVTKVLYCYGVWSKDFQNLPGVEFVKGLPADFEELNSVFSSDSDSHVLLIFDDLVHELFESLKAQNLFIGGSHHNNISIIFTMHNLYFQGRYGRTMKLNVSYWLIFNNSADLLQIRMMGDRYGIKIPLLFAMKEINSMLHGYILIDLSPTNVSSIKVKRDIFPSEVMIGYY